MKQLKLSVSHREAVGTAASKRLRKQGIIPGIIYGKSGNECISVNEAELRKLMRATSGTASLISVTSDKGSAKLTIIEKLFREPSTGAFLHVDFHEVSANEPMHTTLPVHTVGEAVGVKFENGTLEILHHTLHVKCLPKNLPEFINVDITELHAGHSIHVKDLPPIEGVTFLGDPETVVISCSDGRKAAAEAEAAAAPVAEAKESETAKPATEAAPAK